ncbi:MAG: proteasome assembly chaperone family protein [Halarchaeum sp.]
MSDAPQPRATFQRLTDAPDGPTTLVEGLPGHGLVAAIAVDLITRQLDLEHHGTITSEAFPRVASFSEGRVRDPVRVYAGESPPVMTLQSDVAFPDWSFDALTDGVVHGVGEDVDRMILLVGAPAESQAQVGEVSGIATTDDIAADLASAGVAVSAGDGLVGGATGALLAECYHADVPAAALVVRANPYIPDPRAAQAVIEGALEPLVDFDIDTGELAREADAIEERLQQMAEQYRQAEAASEDAGRAQARPSGMPSMYQ